MRHLTWLTAGVGIAVVSAAAFFVLSSPGDEQARPPGIDPDATAVGAQPPSSPRRLRVGDPWPLPAGLDVYYVPATYGKDATVPDLRRVYREEGGQLHEERLLQGELVNAYTLALNLDEGSIGVGVCENWERGTNCGTPSYPAMGDSRAVGYVSRDRGATYAKLGPLPRGAWIHAAVAGELLIGVYANPGAAEPVRFQYFPSGREVSPPAPNSVPLVMGPRGLTWLSDDGTLYRPDGSVVRRRSASGNAAGLPLQLSATNWVESWWEPGGAAPSGQASIFYLGIFGPDGITEPPFTWEADLRPVARISEHLLLGNFSPGQSSSAGPTWAFAAMILDLETGIIHPIPELTAVLRAAGSLSDPFIQNAEPHRD